MPNFIPKSSHVSKKVGKKSFPILAKEELDRFNPAILGLGDLSTKARRVEAMAAVFDLEGFTNFCKQTDPHLSVPVYLSRFLDWLIHQLKVESIAKNYREGARLWHPLPLFLKFMGDGLLVLWNCESMSKIAIRNVVISLFKICTRYESELLSELNRLVVDPPQLLRCGVARGTVFSVGTGEDYVGPCINMAARLQKLSGVSFAYNLRGIDLDNETSSNTIRSLTTVRRVAIRGIGENELVGISKKDIKQMDPDVLSLYKEL